MTESKQNFNLISPWLDLYRKMECLFGEDPAIRLELNEETYTIKLYVEDETKANALAKLLPMHKQLGNIVVNICVVYPNEDTNHTRLFMDAFDGNPILEDVVSGDTPMTEDLAFVIFKPEIVQYHNDNIFSVNRMKTTVYEDLARDIFELPGVYYNTAEKEQ